MDRTEFLKEILEAVSARNAGISAANYCCERVGNSNNDDDGGDDDDNGDCGSRGGGGGGDGDGDGDDVGRPLIHQREEGEEGEEGEKKLQK